MIDVVYTSRTDFSSGSPHVFIHENLHPHHIFAADESEKIKFLRCHCTPKYVDIQAYYMSLTIVCGLMSKKIDKTIRKSMENRCE